MSPGGSEFLLVNGQAHNVDYGIRPAPDAGRTAQRAMVNMWIISALLVECALTPRPDHGDWCPKTVPSRGATGSFATKRVRAKQHAPRVPPLYPLTRAREGRADLSAVGQQRDPLAPPAGRRSRFLFSGWGRNDGARAIGPPAAQPRGHRQRAASKTSRVGAPLPLLAPNPRARGARRASDVGQQSNPHSGGQQSDPRSRPTRWRRRPAGAGDPLAPPEFGLGAGAAAAAPSGRTLAL